jgi:small conductance mechanosensitive channel
MVSNLKELIENSSKVTTLNDITLNLVAAIVILIIGLIIGRFLSNLTRKVLHELELDKILKEQARIKVPITDLISSIVKYVIYIITVILALNQIGLRSFILNIILAILVVLLIIFMILSLKDFVPNLVAGLFLHQKRNFNPGDIIQVNNIEGEVLSITLFETRIKTTNNEIVYIPNSLLTKSVVIKKRKTK